MCVIFPDIVCCLPLFSVKISCITRCKQDACLCFWAGLFQGHLSARGATLLEYLVSWNWQYMHCPKILMVQQGNTWRVIVLLENLVDIKRGFPGGNNGPLTCGKLTSKLLGPATSNYERNFPPLFYVENTKISVYVESPHNFNIFFWECRLKVSFHRWDLSQLDLQITGILQVHNSRYQNPKWLDLISVLIPRHHWFSSRSRNFCSTIL